MESVVQISAPDTVCAAEALAAVSYLHLEEWPDHSAVSVFPSVANLPNVTTVFLGVLGSIIAAISLWLTCSRRSYSLDRNVKSGERRGEHR